MAGLFCGSFFDNFFPSRFSRLFLGRFRWNLAPITVIRRVRILYAAFISTIKPSFWDGKFLPKKNFNVVPNLLMWRLHCAGTTPFVYSPYVSSIYCCSYVAYEPKRIKRFYKPPNDATSSLTVFQDSTPHNYSKSQPGNYKIGMLLNHSPRTCQRMNVLVQLNNND